MFRTAILLAAVWWLLNYSDLSAQTGDSAKAARREAEALFRDGDPEKAVAVLTRSLDENPNDVEARSRRGDAYLALGKVGRAVIDYSEALRFQENNVEVLIRRASVWRALKMHHRALDDFRTALSIQPDHPGALRARAVLLYQKRDFEGALRDAKRLVLFDNDWTGANKRVASTHYARGDLLSAIQAYDRALQVSPDDAESWYWSASAQFKLGRDDEGAERMQHLLRTNPEQAGGHARRSPTYGEPTAADLDHGRRQVEQLLKDRPEMARLVTPDDEIVQWAARKFAGEDVPGRILWDRELPASAWADHRVPSPGKPARVRLRTAMPLGPLLEPTRSFGFEELWSMLAYELHNVQSYQRFREVAEAARDGHLTRDGYVLENTRLEFHALQRTRAWYLDCFRPWAKKNGISTDGRIWRLDMPLTFPEFMEQYQDKSRYPWEPYLAYYDRLQRRKPVSSESEQTAE